MLNSKKLINTFLKECSEDSVLVDILLVNAFVEINELEILEGSFLNEFLETPPVYNDIDVLKYKLIHLIQNKDDSFSLEDLVNLFEFVISPLDKEVNGAVYTPVHIRDYIVSNVLAKIENQAYEELRFIDLSCGCGGFFITLIDQVRVNRELSIANFVSSSVYGVDIADYSIRRTKILLSLYALIHGEVLTDNVFNLIQANSLDNEWKTTLDPQNEGFDAVIGNPPYVGAPRISEASKQYLYLWSVSKFGKSDLYIPFFQVAIEALHDNGVLGYITINSFLKSKNGRGIREYFAASNCQLRVIDFGSEQVFKSRSTYTCICIYNKGIVGGIEYVRTLSSNINELVYDDYSFLPYDTLNSQEGWLLTDLETQQIIQKVTSTGTRIGNLVEIRNGFATLKNDVFLFKVIREDLFCYYFENKAGEIYKVEKAICRDAIKPNIIKSETEIVPNLEKLIFPYEINNGELVPFDEDYFQSNFPYAYAYLSRHKKVLKERDKGELRVKNWFQFGRSQALTLSGNKLLFPYLSEYPTFVLSKQKDLLFYNGYAIMCKSIKELKLLKLFLTSRIYWYFIINTSKPYSGNFFSQAKSYVSRFTIPQFSDEERRVLLSFKDFDRRDEYIASMYGIVGKDYVRIKNSVSF